MKISTVLSSTLALAAVTTPVVATDALFSFTDLASSFIQGQFGGSSDVVVCTPPKVVTCGDTDTQKRSDIESAEADLEKRTFALVPAAACAVSEVHKLKEGLFEVIINFEVAKWDFISKLLGGIVKKLHFTGTGCDDGKFVLIDKSFKIIKLWTQWSTSIVVKPQKVNGKCCLPKDLKLNVEFGGSGVLFSAFTAIFQKSFSWSFSEVKGDFHDFDCFKDFFLVLTTREQQEIQAAGELAVHQQKRFLDFKDSLSIFKQISVSGTTFKNFCWDCDC